MGALIASICCTLIILAFCQIVMEMILPEGGTKRYVVFVTGLVAVIVVLSTVVTSGSNIMKTIYARAAEIRNIAERQKTTESGNGGSNPYRAYIEKLIDTYR